MGAAMGRTARFAALAIVPGVVLAMPAFAEGVPVRLTPFMEIEKTNGGAAIPANTYTRLEITAAATAKGTRIDYEKRKLLWRMGIGKTYTFNSILTVDVGNFTDSVPLLAREYESSSSAGESFSRTVSFDGLGFPYFLAGSDVRTRVARFSARADMAEANSSQVASLGLSALREALKAVAPSSGVVTTLTKDSSKAVADKIDSQADKLFATTVGEELKFDVNLSAADSYRITLYGPTKETDELMKDEQQVLGVWTVRFAEAKPSIFSTITCSAGQCDRVGAYAQATADPAYVLSFKLVDRIGEMGTVKAYLRQQEWWSGDIQNLATTTDTNDRAFGRFCRKIRDAMAELGLNDLDGRIVASSILNSGLVSGAIQDGMRTQADCKFAG